jgi:hypothetical protein
MAAQLAVTQSLVTNCMEKNGMRDRVKCIAKVTVNGIKMALRNNWSKKKIKIGYQISCGIVV